MLYHVTSFVLLRILMETDHSIFLIDSGEYLPILNLVSDQSMKLQNRQNKD